MRLHYSLLCLYGFLFVLGILDVRRMERRIASLEQNSPVVIEHLADAEGNMSPDHVAYVMARVDKLNPSPRPDPRKATATYNACRFAGRSATEATKAAAETK